MSCVGKILLVNQTIINCDLMNLKKNRVGAPCPRATPKLQSEPGPRGPADEGEHLGESQAAQQQRRRWRGQPLVRWSRNASPLQLVR